MSLRNRTLITIGVVLTALVAIMYFIARDALVDGLSEIEQRYAAKEVERVTTILARDQDVLTAVARDYAVWNDTYRFLRTCDENYIRSNLSPATFLGSNINFMLFIDTSGYLVFSKGFDLRENVPTAVPDEIKQELSRPGKVNCFLTKGDVSGVVAAGDNPVLIAAHPILRNGGHSNPRGVLVVGRYLDHTIEEFADSIGVAVRLHGSTELEANPDVADVTDTIVRPISEDHISAFVPVTDIDGNRALVMEAIVPRDLYQRGRSSIIYLLVMVAVAGSIMSGLALWTIEKLVLTRVTQLSSAVKSIGSSGDLSERVPGNGKDELSYLSYSINRMLEAQERSKADLQQAYDELEMRVAKRTRELQAANQAIVEAQDRLNRVLSASPAIIYSAETRGEYRPTYISDNVGRILGYDPAEFTSDPHFWLDHVHPDDLGETLAAAQDVMQVGHGSYRYRFQDKDGSYRWMEDTITMLTDSASESGMLIGHWVDITDRMQAEDALRESQSTLDALMQYVPEGIVIADTRVHTRAMSKYVEDVLGVSFELAQGRALREKNKAWHICRAEDMQPATMDELPLTRAVRAGETVQNEEWVIRYKGGRDVHLLCNAGPIFDSSDKVTGGVLVFRDIQSLLLQREALLNAYSREHHIADVLQRALVPEIELCIPGCSIAARYEPAMKEAEVGGDFYDVFTLPDGRIALVMGDVSGKGLPAAVYTAMAKYMIRGYAHIDPDPGYVLTRLNDALCDYTPEDLFVTIFYGILDLNSHLLVYANGAQNEPLFFCKKLNRVNPLDVTGRAIGVMKNAVYHRKTVKLDVGDLILIYTDGITDAGYEGKYLEREGLSNAFLNITECSEKELASAVFTAATEAAQGTLRDDAAVLVIKITDPQILVSS